MLIFLIGILTLIIAIAGATFAFFSVVVDEATGDKITGTTASMDLDLSIVSKSAGFDNPLIPQKTDAIASAVVGTSNGSCVDDNGNTVYMLRRFMIDVRFQGKGYGTKALKLVLEEIQKKYGCDEVYLSTVPENEKAIHMYEKAGFISTGIEIGDETHKEIIYKCRLWLVKLVCYFSVGIKEAVKSSHKVEFPAADARQGIF